MSRSSHVLFYGVCISFCLIAGPRAAAATEAGCPSRLTAGAGYDADFPEKFEEASRVTVRVYLRPTVDPQTLTPEEAEIVAPLIDSDATPPPQPGLVALCLLQRLLVRAAENPYLRYLETSSTPLAEIDRAAFDVITSRGARFVDRLESATFDHSIIRQ